MEKQPKSFYLFRNPSSGMTESGISVATDHFRGRGFMLSPFCGSRTIFIPASGDVKDTDLADAIRHAFVEINKCKLTSTSRESHRTAVEVITAAEHDNVVRKVVLARQQVIKTETDPLSLFKQLTKSYPKAYVFLFFTPEYGMWIGASPELLLECNGNDIVSKPLAGTRVRGKSGMWPVKDIKEHHVVVDHIADLFRHHCKRRCVNGSRIRRAGPVEHLMSEIRGEMDGNISFIDLLSELSPTPALGGSPRQKAMDMINSLEDFDRGAYGGFCGPAEFNRNSAEEAPICNSATLCVTIRCARLFMDAAVLYAGGGIMPDSDPDMEWNETERKISTLLPFIFIAPNNAASCSQSQ